MLDTRFKAFSSLTELSEQGQIEYKEFQGLNDVIEKGGPLQGYVDVYSSYIMILMDSSDSEVDMSGYSELDFQIKYLMDEVKVPVNKILAFVECKFPLINEKIFGLFSGIFPLSEQQKKVILEVISRIRKGNFVLKVLNKNYQELQVYTLPFDIDGDFVANYVNMQDQISKISLIELMLEYGEISFEFSII